ncbi:MAG: LuxR family transcriptional regulator [Nevskia sp.]|nr:LuxR family transcriptional regulator [Nevskia sp.]
MTGMTTAVDGPQLKPRFNNAMVTPPLISPFDIPRREILAHIYAAARNVVLVHAPAGFGKTTLMRQLWDSEELRGVKNIWLPLSDADNDASRFLSSFAAALYEVLPGGPTPPPERSAELSLWIVYRLNALDGPLNIFFDDLDTLRDPIVIGLMSRGLEVIPQNVRIIAGARNVPEVGFSRLRDKGGIAEVDSDALRFNTSEACDYLIRRRRLPLSQNQIEKLLDCTEGWPAALWLASLALERRYDPVRFLANFSGSNTAIASYFAEDVVAALPGDLRDFILRSSILDELSPALCDAVCEVRNSGEILNQIAQRNLFLQAVRGKAGLFRFHGLFRDFLQTELKRCFAAELPHIHRRATEAYLGSGQPISAVGHALSAGATDIAVHLIISNVDALLSQGHFRMLGGWLDQLPQKELQDNPRLRLIRAWCISFIRGPGEALSAIADIDDAALPAEPAAQLRTLRPMLLARMDRVKEAYDLSIRALNQIPVEPSFTRSMLYEVLGRTSAILGFHDESRNSFRLMGPAAVSSNETGITLADSTESLTDLMTGHLKRALSRLSPANWIQNTAPETPWTGSAVPAIHIAELLYECDHCDAAERLLFANASLVQGADFPDTLISAHVIRSRIASNKGDYDLALHSLDELEASGHRLILPRVVASARLERSTLYLSRNDPTGASEQLLHAKRILGDVGPEAVKLETLWFTANDILTPEIVKFRWMIRTGAATNAISGLRSNLAEAQRSLRARRALKLRILLAEALYCSGERVEGLRIMSRAQHIAQGEGFRRIFLEEGAMVCGMLVELRLRRGEDPNGATDTPASSFRHMISSPDLSHTKAAPLVLDSPLTQKELKVLNMAAQGFLNEAMAERLFVSESTVRTHLRNINAKLHASNRVEAAIIGRRLGLVA